jgi:hypothetical protein
MFTEFDKVVRCLAVELPDAVYADVVAKYGKLKTDVEQLTSTNARDAILVLRDIVAAANSGSLCPTSISVKCAREVLQAIDA